MSSVIESGASGSPSPQKTAMVTCSDCEHQGAPTTERKVSTAGWIVFTILLFLAFPLCWVGLLIKEHRQVCAVCGAKLNLVPRSTAPA